MSLQSIICTGADNQTRTIRENMQKPKVQRNKLTKVMKKHRKKHKVKLQTNKPAFVI